jgi:hypothetical protein
MIDYQNEFVSRTKQLLECHFEAIKKESALEVTFLMNCLLGLVVLVAESNKGKGLIKDKTFLNDIINKDLALEEYQWFLQKIRNAIAHQHIEPDNNNGEWVGVKMWDERDNIMNFEIKLTNSRLKELALNIANDYLNQEQQ